MSVVIRCTGNTPRYRFYLTIGSTRTEVYPLKFLETTLIDDQESFYAFYRRRFSGKLMFTNNNGGNDFDLIYAAEMAVPCSKILIEIERQDIAYWNGYFSTTDGIFDLDRCTYEVTPLQNDEYSDILDKADIQHNILLMDDPATGIPYPPVSVSAFITGEVDPAIVYTRNRWLADVIEFLCDAVMTGATYSSTFFTEAINPVALDDNKLLYLTIAQKSDIKRPTSTTPATTALISFNELMEILWVMFQVKWDYDPALNKFLIEHISYFGMTAGLDLTSQELAKNNKYAYTKEVMPKYEKFAFMEADNTNFVGVPIWYDSACVNPDPDSNVLERRINVTTDLEYIIDNTLNDIIEDEGFVILCNYLDVATYYVDFGSGALNGDARLNMHLSWANLHNNYYRHNRVLIDGYLNGILINFWSAQKVKLQECFAIVCPDDDYDPSDYITTELGEDWFLGEKAKVKTSQLSPSGEMKFSLLYGPDDNINTGVTESKTIFIKQTADDTFIATLTEPPPGNITLELYADIFDDVGAGVCSGIASPETWTIEAGNRTDTFVLTLCAPIPAGGCMELMLDSTGAPGWLIDFTGDYTKYCS